MRSMFTLKVAFSDEPFASDLPPGSTLKRLTPSSPAAAAQVNKKRFNPF